MKRGIIIAGLFIGILLIGNVVSAESIEKDEGFLSTIVRFLSLDWLFKIIAPGIGEAYGECIVDEDCGEPVRSIVSKYCSGKEIWQTVNIINCEAGECFENSFSEFVESAEQCYICDDSSGIAKIVPNDGEPCTVKRGSYETEGVCIGGICEEARCDILIENFGYKKCPRHSLIPEKENYICCAEGEECCGKLSVFPVCCSSDEQCVSKLTLGELSKLKDLKKKVEKGEMSVLDFLTEATKSMFDPLRSSYICEPKEDSCESKGLKKCEGTRGSVCCPKEGIGSECMKYTPILMNIYEDVLNFIYEVSGKDPKFIPEVSIGYCGNKDCPEGTFECEETQSGSLNKGKVCCITGKEECINKNPYASPVGVVVTFYPPFCQSLGCEKGFVPCEYTPDLFNKNEETFRICCKEGVETCVNDPISYLRCSNLAERIGNPSMTKTTSVYMIRSEKEFNLNGKAFVISPHINFSKEIMISINESIEEGEDAFKYEEHDAVLESCNIQELDSVNIKISSKGGSVNLDNQITVDIPAGALNKEVEFTISSYELSNCYEVGKKFDIKGISVPNETISGLEIPEKKSFRGEKDNLIKWMIVIVLFSLILVVYYKRKNKTKNRSYRNKSS